MNNLLLKENKDFLKSEYSSRFWIVTCFFLTITLVVLAGFLFATHIKVNVAEKIAKERVLKVESNEISKQRKEFNEAAQLLNKQIGFLSDKIVDPSIFVDSIISSSNSDILISNINIDLKYIDPSNKKAKESIKISLRGTAKNRSSLLSFQETLNGTNLFSLVDIPYSNFAKSTDIQFTATLNSTKDLIKEKND
jgi:hypothetical protein